MRWIESLAQRFVVSSTKSSWRPVSSCVPQGANTEVNTDIFIDGGADCTFSRFADERKVGGEADALGDCVAIQRDLDKLEK